MTAQQLKSSILQLAVQGKLVPQDPNDEPASVLLERIRVEKQQLVKEGKIKKEKPLPPITDDDIPFDVPKSWEWVRLGTLLDKLTDGTHHTPKYTVNGVPFLSVKDISSGKISFANTKFVSSEEHCELYKRCNPEKYDILLTKVGTTGIPVLVDTDREFSLFVSVALLKFNQDLLCGEYLVRLIESPLVGTQCTEKTRGVGNKNWVMRDIANTLVVLPPLAEQRRIVERIEQLLPHITEYDAAEKKLTALNKEFPDQLKNSILQAAVRGKLVVQDPNDEPASLLLNRIRAEKEQLIKDGKIKKDKPLPPIVDDDIPFDVPESWEWVRLSSIGVLNSGGQYNESNEPNNPYYVKVADMNLDGNKFEITHSSRRCLGKSNDLIPINSVIFPKRGGAILTNKKRIVGRLSICIDSNTMAVTVSKMICFMYFYYWFLGVDLGKMASGSAVPQINNIDIYPLLFPLPPLAEQHRIVAKCEELLAVVKKYKTR